MKRTLAVAATALTLAAATAAPLAAQTMRNTPDEIMAVAQNFGSASVSIANNGRPLLNGNIDGTNYGILMYGCDGPRECESIQFFATFNTTNRTLDHLNAWNEDQRFGAAYVNSNGRVFLHWSVNLDFGVTRDNLRDSFDIWRLTMGEFVSHVSPN